MGKSLVLTYTPEQFKRFPYIIAYANYRGFHQSKLDKQLALAELYNAPLTTTYVYSDTATCADKSELILEKARDYVNDFVNNREGVTIE